MISETSTGVEGEPSAGDGQDELLGDARIPWLRRNWPQLLVVLLACFPALRMAAWISAGIHVQFADYWVFISELIEPDGSVRWSALAEFQGQHLLSLPLLIYLLNIWLFDGSNITLGLILVAIVAVQVVILWNWIRRLERVPFVLQGAILVLASGFLFSPFGAWNFLRAMSGAAWLTANLVVILAVHLAARDRTYAAVAMALLATVTYGTGVMAWPAVILVVVLRRRPLAEVGVAVIVGVAVVATYVTTRSSQVRTETIRSVDPGDVVLGTARIVGRLAGLLHQDLVLVVGLASLAAAIVLVPLSILRCREQAMPFLGLAAYSMLASVQIAYGRSGVRLGNGEIQTSRYTSLGALLLIALTGLAVALLGTIDREPRRRVAMAAVVVPLVLVAACTPFRGSGEARSYLDRDARFLHLADAQRVKVSRQHGWFPLIEQPDIDDRLERIGHHPFDGRWDADCGWLGQDFDRPTESVEGQVSTRSRSSLPDAVEVMVRAPVDRSQVDCVIVAESSGRVVGAGRPETAAGSDEDALLAYAPVSSAPARVLIHVEDGDRWLEVPVPDRQDP